MSVPVRRRRKAQEELFHYVDIIAEDNIDAAIRFIDAFEKACEQLAEHPEMAPLYETDDPVLQAKRIRRWVIPDFPNYLIFYRYEGDVIDVLHLLHAKLDQDQHLLP